MAIIPQGISQLSESILSYLITALTILAFVKIVQMVMNMGGGKGLGGLFGGGNNNTDNTKTTKPQGDSKDHKKTPKEKADDRVVKHHFDPYNPGKVKFLICDEDDNPIQGATILIKPKYAKRSRYRALPAAWTPNRDTWREYKLRSNADGFAPSRDKYEAIGSGVVTIEVNAGGFLLPEYNYQPSVEIKANEEQLIIITMRGRGEKDQLFEPIIKNVEPGRGVIQATGEVV